MNEFEQKPQPQPQPQAQAQPQAQPQSQTQTQKTNYNWAAEMAENARNPVKTTPFPKSSTQQNVTDALGSVPDDTNPVGAKKSESSGKSFYNSGNSELDEIRKRINSRKASDEDMEKAFGFYKKGQWQPGRNSLLYFKDMGWVDENGKPKQETASPQTEKTDERDGDSIAMAGYTDEQLQSWVNKLRKTKAKTPEEQERNLDLEHEISTELYNRAKGFNARGQRQKQNEESGFNAQQEAEEKAAKKAAKKEKQEARKEERDALRG